MIIDNIEHFDDVLRYATEINTAQLVKLLQHQTTIYPDDFDKPVTFINGMSAPNTFSVTTEYSEEFVRQLSRDITAIKNGGNDNAKRQY